MAGYYIVTGAAGFIGSNLVRALNARGERDIIAVDNLTRGDKFNNLVDCEIADYLDKDDFLEALSAGSFDDGIEAVLHQGACSDTVESDGRYMMDNNYRWTAQLLEFCQGEEIPLVYASSAAVYGGTGVFRESREFERPLNVYGYSKFLLDQVVRRQLASRTAPIVGLRYFNVFGPRQDKNGPYAAVIPVWVGRLLANEPCTINGDGDTSRDFCFVKNAVQANILAGVADSAAAGRAYNVACGARTTLSTLFTLLRDGLAGLEADPSRRSALLAAVAAHGPFRPGDVRHSLADIGLARLHLGYEPTHDVGQGLNEALAWYATHAR